MRNFLLTVSALTLLGATAQAQMVFDGGEISASALFPTGSNLAEVVAYGIAGKAAVSFGNIGVQADLGYDTAQSGTVSLYEWDAGLHAYYKFSNAFRAGAFYTSETLSSSGGGSSATFTSFGAEALFDMGNLDVEFSIGGLGGDIVNGMVFSADGYYQISDAFEVNAGVWIYIDNDGAGDQVTIATVGANYTLANMPITLGVSYNAGYLSSSGGQVGGSVSANISYGFGAGSGERLFKTRNFSYLDLTLALND